MRRLLMVAAMVCPGASATAQTANLPEARAVPRTQAPVLEGVPPTKVKTLHLDAKGNAVPGPAPSPNAAAALAPLLPPTVKVPLYRVGPDGTMHAPSGGDHAR